MDNSPAWQLRERGLLYSHGQIPTASRGTRVRRSTLEIYPNPTTNAVRLDLRDLPAGLCVIRVTSGAVEYTDRVMVQ